jgi:cell division protein ZapA (FtsZ GTPase activity inhibitor)
MTTKKNPVKVTILNEEYAIRSDRSPEDTKEVAKYFDQAIRKVMSSGGVVESNRAVVLAGLQLTAELFDAKALVESTEESVKDLSDYVRPLLPPSKRQASGG